MKLFRTVVEIPESRTKLDYEASSMWIGSCFTENIGSRLKELKFPHELNPFGILYNPASINNSLRILTGGTTFTEKDLRYGNGFWYSFSHHSSYSHPDREACLERINESITRAAGMLEKAKFLFITFGTARVFQLKENGEIVSNCHKIPHSHFDLKLLDAGEIVESYVKLIGQLKDLNPSLEIVFTLSPVRHWKDGAHGNQISKSTLLIAISRLVELFDNVSYFPAYEIIMDELRDYRFYDEDMLHINKQGVDYIWEKFQGAYLSPSTIPLIKEITAIRLGTEHRPFNPAGRQHQIFMLKILERISAVEKLIPSADFSRERKIIEHMLEEHHD
jgi:hypothetical protein